MQNRVPKRTKKISGFLPGEFALETQGGEHCVFASFIIVFNSKDYHVFVFFTCCYVINRKSDQTCEKNGSPDFFFPPTWTPVQVCLIKHLHHQIKFNIYNNETQLSGNYTGKKYYF